MNSASDVNVPVLPVRSGGGRTATAPAHACPAGADGLAGWLDAPSPLSSSPITFSTAGVPASRRIELWEQYNARALVPLACRPLLGDALEATERNLRTRRLRLAHITAAPHIVERAPREIERQTISTVLLTVALAGETHVYHSQGVVTLRPGQALLSDEDTPSMRAYARGHDHLFVAVPKTVYRDLVVPELPRPYEVFELSGGGGRPGPGTALAKLVGTAVRTESPDADALERQVLALLRAMVTGRAGDGASSQLAAAQAFVRQNLADTGLSAATIAAAVGVSERQVSRIFSEHGGVAGWVTDQRLDLALRLLSAPGHHSVGQTARECGFGSQSYFARVFKRRFGASPRDVATGTTWATADVA